MQRFSIKPSITNREPIKQYLKDISKIPLLTPEEEKEIATKARDGDKKSLDKLITSNLRFVISVAKQYQNRGVNFEDLINEGNSGLIRAAQLFDPNKGVRFLSYAVWWIRQAIIKSIYNGGKTIRIPINQIRDKVQVTKAIRLFEQINERLPTTEELEELTGFPEEKISKLLDGDTETTSFDTPFSDDEDSGTLLDVTPNKDAKDSDSKLMEESLTQQINEILDLLPNRDHDILRLYFGIGVQKLTTRDISQKFGITMERVRQLKDKAIRRLQTIFKKDLNRILYGYN